MDVIGVGRNRERPEIKRNRNTAGYAEARAKIIVRGLRIKRAVEVVLFHPRHVDRMKQRRGEESDRRKTDNDPTLAVFAENRLA